MRAARLHGLRDLRVDEVPVPRPAAGELLVRVEACGVCPTDVRKYLIGLGGDRYPFNPGHEWVGRIEAVGADAPGWQVGRRVYGDTYAGYAEYATLPVEPAAWSYGPLLLDEALPLDRAVFVEPLADCLHAVRDQARVEAGQQLVVLGAGQMGLQIVAAAVARGVRVLAVEPLPERRELARSFGAEAAVPADGWQDAARAWAERGADAVVLSIGVAGLVRPAIEAAAPGGRVVLFAGFGADGEAVLDLNRIHYEEIAVVGSEWIGTPPNERRELYGEAHDLLAEGLALERLVDLHCGLEGLEAAFEDVRLHRRLKAVAVPSR